MSITLYQPNLWQSDRSDHTVTSAWLHLCSRIGRVTRDFASIGTIFTGTISGIFYDFQPTGASFSAYTNSLTKLGIVSWQADRHCHLNYYHLVLAPNHRNLMNVMIATSILFSYTPLTTPTQIYGRELPTWYHIIRLAIPSLPFPSLPFHFFKLSE